jgi:hypothetical protein
MIKRYHVFADDNYDVWYDDLEQAREKYRELVEAERSFVCLYEEVYANEEDLENDVMQWENKLLPANTIAQQDTTHYII